MGMIFPAANGRWSLHSQCQGIYGAPSIFLPPEKDGPDPDEDDMSPRAVVFVTEHSRKGTDRSGQEYADPLLVLSGEEHERIPFVELHEKLCASLRGNRPRPVMWSHEPDGSTRVLFADDSVVTVPAKTNL
jgi:hypothetical protein